MKDLIGEVCKLCEPGFYTTHQNTELSCKRCGRGTYQSGVGQATCAQCAAGKSTNGNDGQPMCDSCAAGRFSSVTGSSDCADCDVGQYSDFRELGKSCTECPENTYNNKVAAEDSKKCLQCPRNMKTYIEGRSRKSECLCISSFYADEKQGDADKDPWIPCLKCPKGGICLSDRHGHIMDADEGFWTPPNGTTTHPEDRFYKCHLDGCLGGDHIKGGMLSRCAPGYEGVLCALCSDGRFKKGFKCETCEAKSILPFIILIFGFIFCCTVAVVIFRMFVHSKRMRKYNKIWRDVQRLVKIMIAFAQILEGTSTVYSGVVWPTMFTQFWRVLNIVGLDFISLSGISCAAKIDFYMSFIGQMCVPLFVIFYLSIFYVFKASHIHVKERFLLSSVKSITKKMKLKIETGMKIEKVSIIKRQSNCPTFSTNKLFFLAPSNVYSLEF